MWTCLPGSCCEYWHCMHILSKHLYYGASVRLSGAIQYHDYHKREPCSLPIYNNTLWNGWNALYEHLQTVWFMNWIHENGIAWTITGVWRQLTSATRFEGASWHRYWFLWWPMKQKSFTLNSWKVCGVIYMLHWNDVIPKEIFLAVWKTKIDYCDDWVHRRLKNKDTSDGPFDYFLWRETLV